MKKIIIKTLFICFIVISCLLITIILKKYCLIKKDINGIKEVQAKIINEDIDCSNMENIMLSKYASLYEENNDLIGWIKIDDTEINYPVMYTPNDKNFYLYKNWNKEDSKVGLPYIDERCNIENSENLIIYGHCMKNGQMFGGLKKYKNKEYYEQHKTIKFDTLYEEHEYEIVSVFVTKVFYSDENIDEDFLYYDYLELEDEGRYQNFIENIQEKSIYKINRELHNGDKFITLSTCDYSFENARLVVIAVQK